MAKQFLDEWIQLKPTKIRKAYVFHNASLDNFKRGKKSYFLDISFCKKDFVIYDFISFYQCDVLRLDMFSFYQRYYRSFPLRDDEEKLLLCFLCIPNKISFKDSVYHNTVSLQKELNVRDKTFQFVASCLEKDKENQEANKEKFKDKCSKS